MSLKFKIMKCDCGGTEKKTKVSKEISLAGRKVFVTNIDAWICEKRGETGGVDGIFGEEPYDDY